MPLEQSLPTSTTFSSDDYVRKVDNPGGTPESQNVTFQNFMAQIAGMQLQGGFENFNPADATTYYFGIWEALAPTATPNFRRMYAMRTGTIRRTDIYISGTAGSNQTGTLSLRKNNTTDYSISTTIDLSTLPFHQLVSGLAIPVTTGDYFEFKWLTPTWTTNPTGLYATIKFLIEG